MASACNVSVFIIHLILYLRFNKQVWEHEDSENEVPIVSIQTIVT